jgi:predicted N-formylglutamate amidohydrolase
VLSCEHARHAVPLEFAERFAAAGDLLESHRGFDAGALDLARALAARLEAPLQEGEWTRLLVDLNRSEHHRGLFSELTRPLPAEVRSALVERYHAPYRRALRDLVTRLDPPVVHLGVHSFTPVLKGKQRSTAIGLLYDPRRPAERALACAWRAELRRLLPGLAVHLNRPYQGQSDGVTTWLRGLLGPRRYLGLELEVNQAVIGDLDPDPVGSSFTLALASVRRDEATPR